MKEEVFLKKNILFLIILSLVLSSLLGGVSFFQLLVKLS